MFWNRKLKAEIEQLKNEKHLLAKKLDTALWETTRLNHLNMELSAGNNSLTELTTESKFDYCKKCKHGVQKSIQLLFPLMGNSEYSVYLCDLNCPCETYKNKD